MRGALNENPLKRISARRRFSAATVASNFPPTLHLDKSFQTLHFGLNAHAEERESLPLAPVNAGGTTRGAGRTPGALDEGKLVNSCGALRSQLGDAAEYQHPLHPKQK